MVSKFKRFDGFGGNFSLRGDSVLGATRLPGIFFLDFLFTLLLYSYFLINCLVYILVI